MRTLIASYDKLKGKFNSFAAKCLSEKQKRESGMILQAPPLLMQIGRASCRERVSSAV